MVNQVKSENITDDAVQSFLQQGYELVFMEYVMEHDLSEIPKLVHSVPLTLKSWTASSQKDFYDVYTASFKDRPGFPGWSMEKWVE